MLEKRKFIKYWISKGIEFADVHHVYLDQDITIGAGTFIGTGVHILKGSIIGDNCRIHEFSSIKNTTLKSNVEIFPFSIVHDSFIGEHTLVGPFAHVSTNSHIEAHTVIGNFVEVKRSTIGAHTKAKHLSYLGDALVGNNVNIGAGTITCNHNGIIKQKTIIEDNAYIGSNNSLVAPIKIGKNAFTAAGSTITADVPADALAIGRARQTNKEGYAQKLKAGKNVEIKNENKSFAASIKNPNDFKTNETI